jgi:hypothetical protein
MLNGWLCPRCDIVLNPCFEYCPYCSKDNEVCCKEECNCSTTIEGATKRMAEIDDPYSFYAQSPGL